MSLSGSLLAIGLRASLGTDATRARAIRTEIGCSHAPACDWYTALDYVRRSVQKALQAVIPQLIEITPQEVLNEDEFHLSTEPPLLFVPWCLKTVSTLITKKLFRGSRDKRRKDSL